MGFGELLWDHAETGAEYLREYWQYSIIIALLLTAFIIYKVVF